MPGVVVRVAVADHRRVDEGRPGAAADVQQALRLRDDGTLGDPADDQNLGEDVEELEGLGIDVVVHLYAGAGEALADRAVEAQQEHGV